MSKLEMRNFMDDERQITLRLEGETWHLLQELANEVAQKKGWLNGTGSDWEYLNIWIIGRLSKRPKGETPDAWVAKALE